MRNCKKIILLLSAFFLMAAARPLKVGMELDYPPFETIDKEGKPSGISVDIAHALGRYLQRDIVIENIPFIGLIPALQNGTIDLILSSMSDTPEREHMISFSDPYMTLGLALLISKKSDLAAIAQANQTGRTIVVKQATTSMQWALKHLPNAKVRVLDKESMCILEVVQGKADAFIYDQLAVCRAWLEYPNETRANLAPFQEQHFAVGLRKDEIQLREDINAFIKKFSAGDGFKTLANKYLPEEQIAFKKLDIPFPLR